MSVKPIQPINAPSEDPDALLPPPPDPAEGQDIVHEETHDETPQRRREGVVSDPDARPGRPRP